MNPTPMPLSWPAPPKRPLKPVELPSLVLVVAVLVVVVSCQPAYANGFSSDQIVELVSAAKTAVEWGAAVTSLIGTALVVTIWRLSHTLTQLNQRVVFVEKEQERVAQRLDAIAAHR